MPEFNYFSMFAPDQMHDFELGSWKRVYKHLIRMCAALGTPTNPYVIQQLDERYIVWHQMLFKLTSDTGTDPCQHLDEAPSVDSRITRPP
jgi:hypothetical protein